MNRVRYFKCKNCDTLIRYLNWNKAREKQINNIICPYCSKPKSLKTLSKRPYYRLKHKYYVSLCVKHNGEYIVISWKLKEGVIV